MIIWADGACQVNPHIAARDLGISPIDDLIAVWDNDRVGGV
jgi:hypothetical protein